MNNYEVTENIKEFILGGKADFTILQDATEKTKEQQFKYRVTIPKDQTPDTTNVWYVQAELADGTAIEQDGQNMKYQGYLKKDLSFNIGAKGMQDYNQKSINGLIWILSHADNIPSVVHIYHHGKCSVCGRKLTDAKSLRCGVGPTCRQRVGITD
jgi:hypothetical protein